jgi:hypothetical protein
VQAAHIVYQAGDERRVRGLPVHAQLPGGQRAEPGTENSFFQLIGQAVMEHGQLLDQNRMQFAVPEQVFALARELVRLIGFVQVRMALQYLLALGVQGFAIEGVGDLDLLFQRLDQLVLNNLVGDPLVDARTLAANQNAPGVDDVLSGNDLVSFVDRGQIGRVVIGLVRRIELHVALVLVQQIALRQPY